MLFKVDIICQQCAPLEPNNCWTCCQLCWSFAGGLIKRSDSAKPCVPSLHYTTVQKKKERKMKVINLIQIPHHYCISRGRFHPLFPLQLLNRHNEIQRCQSMSSSQTKLCQTQNVNQLSQVHGCAFIEDEKCTRASQNFSLWWLIHKKDFLKWFLFQLHKSHPNVCPFHALHHTLLQ